MIKVNMNYKTRLDYVDFMRGIAILLVVIGHLIQTNDIFYAHNHVFEFIYSFHMPLFFAISGYIIAKTSKVTTIKDLGIFFIKKFIALCVPLLTWELLMNRFILRTSFVGMTYSDIATTILHPGLWFLKTLFVITIGFGIYDYLVNKLSSSKYLLIKEISVIFTFLVYVIIIKSGFEQVNLLMFSGVFFVGVYISKYKQIEEIISKESIFFLALTMFLVFSTQWRFINNGSKIYDLEKVLVSCSIFICLLTITKTFDYTTFYNKLFTKFGKYSLAIYVTHWCLLCIGVSTICLDKMNCFWQFFLYVLIGIIICEICVCVSKLFAFSKWLNFILYGKRFWN